MQKKILFILSTVLIIVNCYKIPTYQKEFENELANRNISDSTQLYNLIYKFLDLGLEKSSIELGRYVAKQYLKQQGIIQEQINANSSLDTIESFIQYYKDYKAAYVETFLSTFNMTVSKEFKAELIRSPEDYNFNWNVFKMIMYPNEDIDYAVSNDQQKQSQTDL